MAGRIGEVRYTFGPVDFSNLFRGLDTAAEALRELTDPVERMRVRYVSLGLDGTAMPWREFSAVCQHTAAQTRGTVIGVIDRAMAELIIHSIPAIYRHFPARFAAARLEWSLRALYGLRNDRTALYGSFPSVRTLEAYERHRRGEIAYTPYRQRRKDGQSIQRDARKPRKRDSKRDPGTGARDRAHGKAGARGRRIIEVWMGGEKLPDWGN